MKFKTYPVLFLLFGAWLLLTNAMVDPNNPPTGKTGAPGESTCSTTSGCHTGGTFTGTVSISGVPDTIVAGQTYSITLTNTSNAVRAGFQLTCWDGANAMCGTLSAATGVNIGNGTGNKKYARQSSPKLLSNGSASWTFNWKAPTSAANNTATFYFVSLCANNDGNKTGDVAIKSSKQVVLKTTSPSFEPEQLARVNFFPTLVQHNMLHIELLEAENGQIIVFDLNGKSILEQTLSKINDLNVNGLPKGIYSAQILAGGKVAVKKFVVE